jgi:hypothetical protein
MRLLVQQDNSKFLNNIAITKLNNTDMISSPVSNNIYSLYYTYKFEAVIFSAEQVTDEIKQFIAEFFDNIQIFIYHQYKQPNPTFLKEFKSLKHLCHKPQKYCITIPLLLNNQIFNRDSSKYNKTESIIGFLDNLTEIPANLQKILYPHSKQQIKLYNNSNINHPQNLGMLTEGEKADILYASKYYLGLEDNYALEASIAGCDIFMLSDSGAMLPKKNTKIPAHITYEEFILEKLL